VQNLVPTVAGAERQVSTSSKVDLAFHTETAFHPHAPRYLVLLCLRGHPDARTTLCSVHDVISALDAETIDVLRQPRFTCGVDESFLDGMPQHADARHPSIAVAARLDARGPLPVIGGTAERPTFWFDAELMRGTDPAAQAALDQLGRAVADRQSAVVLEAGDCLVVDNTVAVHGRSSYAARFDGTDRWLQRSFVVSDLASSAADRNGRIIATSFR
jgi:alpha-ketoglutarate-dependent taurine dioxygenase